MAELTVPVTTAAAIRTSIIGRIVALVPRVEPGKRYKPSRESEDFRTLSARTKSACLRSFSVRFMGGVTPPLVSNTDIERVGDDVEIVVAYPTGLRFGVDGMLDTDDVIAEDLRQIEHEVGSSGFANLNTDLGMVGAATVLTIGQTREDGPPVTFGVLRLHVEFYRSNTP